MWWLPNPGSGQSAFFLSEDSNHHGDPQCCQAFFFPQGEEVDRKEHGKRKIRIENKWEMLDFAALQVYYINK